MNKLINQLSTRCKINESFYLYDLRVEVMATSKRMVCSHKSGDYFEMSGENISIPLGQTFTIYSMSALLPLLPVKQRMTSPNDFITTDTRVACPDPHCGAVFKISRTKKRRFYHSEVTVVPLGRKRAE